MQFIDVDKQENTYVSMLLHMLQVCVIHGDDVSQMKYNCAEMRPHLIHCLDTGI